MADDPYGLDSSATDEAQYNPDDIESPEDAAIADELLGPDTSEQEAPSEEMAVNRPQFEPPIVWNEVGYLDKLKAKRQKEALKWNQAAINDPVYNFDGQLIRADAPDPNIPISQEYYMDPRIINRYGLVPRKKPVQQEIADQQMNSIPMNMKIGGIDVNSDADIYNNRARLYKILNDESGGGVIGQDTLANSKIWEGLKGIDSDTAQALRQTTMRALKPFVDKHNTLATVNQEFDDLAADPLAKMLLEEFQGKLGKSPAKDRTILGFVAQKADYLKGNMKDFEEVMSNQHNPDAEDAADRIMSATTIGQVESAFGKYEKSKAAHEALRTGLHETLAASLADASKNPTGDLVEGVQEQLDQLIDFGAFDKNKPLLNKLVTDLQKSDQVDLRKIFKDNKDLIERFGDQPAIMPGFKTLKEEQVVKGKITKMIDEGTPQDQIFIDAKGKIQTMDKYLKFGEDEFERVFGGTKQKDSGRFMEIPMDIIKDKNGNTVFLSIEGANQTSPFEYVFNGKRYVDRAILSKFGLTIDDIKTAVKDNEPIEVSAKAKFLAPNAQKWKPSMVEAKTFMADEIDGVKIKDGMRFAVDKAYLQARQEALAQDHYTAVQSLPFAADPEADEGPEGFLKAAAKDFAYLFGVKTQLKIASTAKQIGTVTLDYNVKAEAVKAAFYSLIGDKESAKQSWDFIKDEYNRNDPARIDEYLKPGGRIDVDVLVNSKDANKYGVFVGSLAGNLTGMMEEIFIYKGAGGGAVLSKIVPTLSKVLGYQAKLKELGIAAETVGTLAKSGMPAAEFAANVGKGKEILATLKSMQRANLILGSALDMVAVNVIEGRRSPTELAEGATIGAMGGLASAYGRGARFFKNPDNRILQEVDGLYKVAADNAKVPWYPSGGRVGAATLSAAGTFGVDALRMSLEGKNVTDMTGQEIAQLLAMSVLPLFGQHNWREGVIKGISENKSVKPLDRPAVLEYDINRYMDLDRRVGKHTPEEAADHAELSARFTDPNHENATKLELTSRAYALAQRIKATTGKAEYNPLDVLELHNVLKRLNASEPGANLPGSVKDSEANTHAEIQLFKPLYGVIQPKPQSESAPRPALEQGGKIAPIRPKAKAKAPEATAEQQAPVKSNPNTLKLLTSRGVAPDIADFIIERNPRQPGESLQQYIIRLHAAHDALGFKVPREQSTPFFNDEATLLHQQKLYPAEWTNEAIADAKAKNAEFLKNVDAQNRARMEEHRKAPVASKPAEPTAVSVPAKKPVEVAKPAAVEPVKEPATPAEEVKVAAEADKPKPAAVRPDPNADAKTLENIQAAKMLTEAEQVQKDLDAAQRVKEEEAKAKAALTPEQQAELKKGQTVVVGGQERASSYSGKMQQGKEQGFWMHPDRPKLLKNGMYSVSVNVNPEIARRFQDAHPEIPLETSPKGWTRIRVKAGNDSIAKDQVREMLNALAREAKPEAQAGFQSTEEAQHPFSEGFSEDVKIMRDVTDQILKESGGNLDAPTIKKIVNKLTGKGFELEEGMVKDHIVERMSEERRKLADEEAGLQKESDKLCVLVNGQWVLR